MTLSDKAMLVNLFISQWTARKFDRNVTKKVNDEYAASDDAGRYNKALIAKDSIAAIQKIANKARTYHYENTLPWHDDGGRLMTSEHYFEYTRKMAEFRHEFDREVRAFTFNYPSYIAEARTRLNGMFNHEDYPEPDEIESKFKFKVTVDPLPDAEDFRVNLGDMETKKIQEEIEARTLRAQETAMNDLWKRLHKVVAHMAQRLSDKDAIFRDTLVTNVVELVQILPRLNFTNNPLLTKMTREVEIKLVGHNPVDLREDKGYRKEVAQDAQTILDAMDGYMKAAA